MIQKGGRKLLATMCDNRLHCHKFTDEEVFFVVFKNERDRSVSMLACPMEEQVFAAITRYANIVTNVAKIFKINTEGEVTQLKCTFENGYFQLLPL
jgi:hypothetical protein